MNRAAYLERIDYRGVLTPTADALRRLQLAHLQTVPFENLSIHSREPIVLDDDSLFDKIVRRRRGGFCYELNGLFAALLRDLGFDVTMLSAEVANAQGVFGPDFDHMALMVTLDQRWLVDVGFGDSFLEPLLLDSGDVQVQGARAYRIDTKGHRVVNQRDNDVWSAQYRLTLAAHTYDDYGPMCRYHQTSPDSHFTKRRVCSRATPEGRVTLSGMRLIVTENVERRERELSDDAEYREVLREHFRIVMA